MKNKYNHNLIKEYKPYKGFYDLREYKKNLLLPFSFQETVYRFSDIQSSICNDRKINISRY